MAGYQWWNPATGQYEWTTQDHSQDSYDRPLNPDFGTPGGGDQYLGAPLNTTWDPKAGVYQAGAPSDTITPPTGDNQTLDPKAPGPTTVNTNTGISPWNTSFSAPSMQGMPQLPTVPNAPQPNLPSYTPPPAFSYADYQGPDPFSYSDWKAPSAEEAINDPGYQFRLGQGNQQLQGWAAAHGTLNDSGTAKALIDYGQNAGSQEYQNLWNRDFSAYNQGRQNALQTYNTNEGNRSQTYNTNRAGAVQQYNTNYQTQYTDPYKFAYQSAIDSWIPQQETWRAGVDMSKLGYSTTAAATQHSNDMSYANSWNQYLNDYNVWRDKNFNIPFALANA